MKPQGLMTKEEAGMVVSRLKLGFADADAHGVGPPPKVQSCAIRASILVVLEVIFSSFRHMSSCS